MISARITEMTTARLLRIAGASVSLAPLIFTCFGARRCARLGYFSSLLLHKAVRASPEAGKGGNVTRPRAADDFATIRARIEELRRERAQAFKKDDAGGAEGAGHAARGLFRGIEGRGRSQHEASPSGSSNRRADFDAGRNRALTPRR
jgi:hypothetical protein